MNRKDPLWEMAEALQRVRTFADRRRAVEAVHILAQKLDGRFEGPGAIARVVVRIGFLAAGAKPIQLQRLLRLAELICYDQLDELGPLKALVLDGEGNREVIRNPFADEVEGAA